MISYFDFNFYRKSTNYFLDEQIIFSKWKRIYYWQKSKKNNKTHTHITSLYFKGIGFYIPTLERFHAVFIFQYYKLWQNLKINRNIFLKDLNNFPWTARNVWHIKHMIWAYPVRTLITCSFQGLLKVQT